MAIVATLVGIPVLINYLRSRNSWVECDGKTLRSSWGAELNLDQINEVDKKKWQTKGIAKIWYEKDGGEQKFVLDDFKYDRAKMDEIMRQIESNLDRDKITGGPTQEEYDREKEEKELAAQALEDDSISESQTSDDED